MNLTESQLAQCRAEFVEWLDGTPTWEHLVSDAWQAAWRPRLTVEQIAERVYQYSQSFHDIDSRQINNCSMNHMEKRKALYIAKAIHAALLPDQSARIAELKAQRDRLLAALQIIEITAGPWMSAAIDDPSVCNECKSDFTDAINLLGEVRWEDVE